MTSRSSCLKLSLTLLICGSSSAMMRPLAVVWARVCSSSGMAQRVVRLSMCESSSWASKRTRESGVDRSSGESLALLVATTSALAKAAGRKSGARKVS
ncbi:hypothetical protein CDD83_4256 [Cordyceps sp. RAO-2017]|nr:hypothetical protein CDD83_4256 [Cordyceps sp. RAO-2017]